MKYLIIDGNNLAYRAAFANEELKNREGIPTGVHYGVFQSLVGLKQLYPEHRLLIAWDGKSKRRVQEANHGVKIGIIPEGYKANRKDKPQPVMDFFSQAPFLQKGIGKAGIDQIKYLDFEADDVVASYCYKLRDDNEIVLVTSDKDYFQLLHENVQMWDGMKQKLIVKDEWVKDFGIDPTQHVDVGSLMGDAGDNIFGIPGWGEKTALKAIQEHGTYRKVLDVLHAQYDSIRVDFPDLKGDDFKKLAELKTPKEQEKQDNGEKYKCKYPHIKEDMPFTGVALAIEEKRCKLKKSGLKGDIMALIFEKRVELAYSLKSMDLDIPNLPEIDGCEPDKQKLLEYFEYYDMESLMNEVDLLL